MKLWVKGGLTGVLCITIIYLFSIFTTLLHLDGIVFFEIIVGIMMYFLRIHDLLTGSYFAVIFLFAYTITLAYFLVIKESKMKRILLLFILSFCVLFLLFYILPKYVNVLLFLGTIGSSFVRHPTLCCPPYKLQGPLFGWIYAFITNSIAYFSIGALIGFLIEKRNVKV